MGTAKGRLELSDLLTTPHNKAHPTHISSKYLFLTNIFTTIIVPGSCLNVTSDCTIEQHIQVQLLKEFHIQMISRVSCYIILTILQQELAVVLNKRHSLEEPGGET